jgi:hypothetical protein
VLTIVRPASSSPGLSDQTTEAHKPTVADVRVAHDRYIAHAGSPSVYRPSGFTAAAHAAGLAAPSRLNSMRTPPNPYNVNGGPPAGMNTVPV